jgi:predicted dinucleotide-binding enzyme
MAGKVLIDASNPIDFSSGDPLPVLRPGNGDSLAEMIQRTYPRTPVVKALNTVNAELMVNPSAVAGEHLLFMAGDDERAKALALDLLGELGWPADRVMDLGGLVAARALEAYLLLWVAVMRTKGTSLFNVSLTAN